MIEIDRRGGSFLFNNNVDLLATFGEQHYAVEVKNLARHCRPSTACNMEWVNFLIT